MAAEMALAPVTVKAEGTIWETVFCSLDSLSEKAIPIGETGIAEGEVAYKIPSYSYAWNDVTDEEGYKKGNLYIGFERCDSDISYFGTVPDGYKGISTFVHYDWEPDNNDEWYGYEIPDFYLSMDAENSQNWTQTDNIDSSMDWVEDAVIKYNFAVDCDGTSYSECWMAYSPEGSAGKIEVVVPQQYNGAITFTINGVKLENGDAAADDSASITYYLQGNGASAIQPALPEPAADPQPTEQTADPQPEKPAADPQP